MQHYTVSRVQEFLLKSAKMTSVIKAGHERKENLQV